MLITDEFILWVSFAVFAAVLLTLFLWNIFVGVDNIHKEWLQEELNTFRPINLKYTISLIEIEGFKQDKIKFLRDLLSPEPMINAYKMLDQYPCVVFSDVSFSVYRQVQELVNSHPNIYVKFEVDTTKCGKKFGETFYIENPYQKHTMEKEVVQNESA